ncbi:hypothetical protein, partial [Barnesiella intestinihominis]|uniref:hypothetical protein n=1 Tax=Barnesiella intestinihominis TaxID=487174 RepID=UPI0039670F17
SQKYNIKEINNYICFFKYSFSIMMWKYIYAAFLMIAFTACHTNKTLEKSDKPARLTIPCRNICPSPLLFACFGLHGTPISDNPAII